MIVIGSKVLSDADCKYALSDNLRSGDDGQILIPKEICDRLDWNWNSEFSEVEVKIHKANLITALKFASVYGKSDIFHKGKKIILDHKWYEEQLKNIETHFGDSDVSICKIHISLSTGNRHYVNGLKQESGLNLQEFTIPKYSSLVFKKQDEDLIIEIDQNHGNLRGFCFGVFKILVKEFGDEFLKKHAEEVETKIGEFNYKGVIFKDYFGSTKLLGIFELGQAKKVINSENRFRYQKEPVKILHDNKEIYFSTEFEFKRSNESHILFDDFKHFVEKYSNNKYSILKDTVGNYQLINTKEIDNYMKPLQKIFFGPPGSGKSHQIKFKYPGTWPRITFHPELDYQGFIGAYKPSVIATPEGDQITYRFIEEAFLRAYCKAWDSEEPYFLIIEEINRGNCAQIFGDIFQLLDRAEDGFSEYPIICSPDIQRHLNEELKGTSRLKQYNEKTGAVDFSRMSLPDNLNILCTMNTSDQSLFPMDSAFKRRWDWQYVPIDYKDAENFRIDLEDGKNEINWGEFIEAINIRIKEHTQSEDKQIGNRFVSPRNNRISKEQFVSKVVFYLWSEIYKEEHGSGLSIFPASNKGQDGLTFSDFFKRNGEVDAEITRWFIEFNLPKETEKNSAIEEGEIEVTKGEE
jgi:hypothetical protein